jgi:hypothetical protein
MRLQVHAVYIAQMDDIVGLSIDWSGWRLCQWQLRDRLFSYGWLALPGARDARSIDQG